MNGPESFAEQAVSLAGKKALYETAAENLETWRRVLFEHGVYLAALDEIANMPTSELNPDGDEQAASSMQQVAKDALGVPS